MAEGIGSLVRAAGLIVSVIGAWWVWQDANQLKKKGANVTPVLWGVLVFLIWLVSLPLYLLLRRFLWRGQLTQPLDLAKEFE